MAHSSKYHVMGAPDFQASVSWPGTEGAQRTAAAPVSRRFLVRGDPFHVRGPTLSGEKGRAMSGSSMRSRGRGNGAGRTVCRWVCLEPCSRLLS